MSYFIEIFKTFGLQKNRLLKFGITGFKIAFLMKF
jgi:hypothetical protein